MYKIEFYNPFTGEIIDTGVSAYQNLDDTQIRDGKVVDNGLIEMIEHTAASMYHYRIVSMNE